MLLPVPQFELALASLGLIVAGVVKGVTGIGYAPCAMPLLAMAVGLETALALVVVPAIVSNAAVLFSGRELTGVLMRFRLLYAGILPGIACGTALLGLVDTAIATHGLALLTLVYVVLAIAKPQLSLPARLEQPLALPAGLLNGVLTGLTGSQIVPLVPYMLALRLDAGTQVQAINLAVTIASLALGAALIASGIMTGDLVVLSCAGALPAIAGTLAGNLLRGAVPVEGVRRLTLAVLVVVAVSLVGRGAWEATRERKCGAHTAASVDCLARVHAELLPITATPDPR